MNGKEENRDLGAIYNISETLEDLNRLKIDTIRCHTNRELHFTGSG